MTPDWLAKLRGCCRDDAVFQQVQRLVTEREHQSIQILGQLGQAILDQVQQSLDFDATLAATLRKMRLFLEVDRIAVYRFHPDWSGEFVSESVAEGWKLLVQEQFDQPILQQNISECSLQLVGKLACLWTDTQIQATEGNALTDRPYFVANDIFQRQFDPCYLEMLQRYQVRAYAIVPILVEDRLWGLLAAYQNTGPRDWQGSEVNLLVHAAMLFGSSLQVADSLQLRQTHAQRQQILANIADRIRQPLQIDYILALSTQETREALQVDRVAVYRFCPDWSGEFVAESVAPGWVPLVGPDIHTVWEDTYLQETQGGRYVNHETFAVEDIDTAGLKECHLDLLRKFQARAFAIAPIFTQQKLWGLLAAYQNSGTRSWHTIDLELLTQLGIQMGIALTQAELITALRQEVVDRQQAELSIRQLNWELKQSVLELTLVNKELESFSYSVSHDLRAPLRSIDGFSQFLLEDYHDRIDEAGQDYLRRIRAATQRMGNLIDDLLNLARVTRSELHIQPVDLSQIARAIAQDLQGSNPERPVVWLIQDGLVAQADPTLLRVVLTNLLDNAWKFSARQDPARIKFGATLDQASNLLYFVKDNGAGFDMTYADKLFGAFQRLHSLHEFPGNGIGLATIQRIIHRHGGRIWAEAAVGQGANFYFTLGYKGLTS